jgi:hypothetical protein
MLREARGMAMADGVDCLQRQHPAAHVRRRTARSSPRVVDEGVEQLC